MWLGGGVWWQGDSVLGAMLGAFFAWSCCLVVARAGIFRLEPSRAELGHFYFRAETELTICTLLGSKFFNVHY